MAAMIFFNGAALESSVPARVADVLVSPIEREIISRAPAGAAGSLLVRARDGVRRVTISLALPTADPDVRQERLLSLSAWARSDVPGVLRLPGCDGRHLLALCTSLPSPSALRWWQSDLRVEFTCFDPYWRADAEKAVPCGEPFTALGSAPPLMRVTRTLSSTEANQVYSNGLETMTFTSLPAGEMEIDLNRQIAAVDDESVMRYCTLDSIFLRPRCGEQTIAGTGMVRYRERWA